ncbi:MAG: alpha-L-fucosidase [Candidatus Sumerlaeota bacterium]|nr:alpha-L-fucosidase [Candidatus Sumerlaeota bacterium]
MMNEAHPICGVTLAVAAMLTGAAAFGEPQIADGPFKPDFESLKQYKCPDWFRDAKFGIWAHWGPQCVPMFGDWYAKRMYMETDKKYKYHLEHFGHPSKFGYKDIIPLWTAEKFDPDRLMALYKAAGARYFVSMGVHHDNFDLWNSKFHSWNAVNMGPHRDIVGAWKAAAQKQGLKFGVSEHLGASFTWFQPSHGADTTGTMKGVPFDGADPKYAELYHPLADKDDKAWYSVDPRWHQEWLNRITDLLDNYQPDLLYTDGALPFGETGRKMLSHFYNANVAAHGSKLEAVYCLKDWRPRTTHGEYVDGIGVQDVERGGLAGIKPEPWQTDTSIADWFYNADWKIKDTGKPYRNTDWVVRTLADIVSKNGNMLLNIVQRPDGSLDADVEQLLSELAAWMKINSEAIHGTRPWKVYGEGRTQVTGGHFKEDFAYSAEDIRFTTKGDVLYALCLGAPQSDVTIKALAAAGADAKKAASVNLLGFDGKLDWQQTADALVIKPVAQWPCKHAVAFRIEFAK